MGDTLTGIVASLLAQRTPARDALLGAVWLHGAAADELVARGAGPLGIAAGDLVEPARAILNRKPT
jgi:NAD(P)H-hydrate repair Nnr-like enzyme with NAD(P)H-hydrate dehydratase domain